MTFKNTAVDVPDELIFAHAEGRVVFFCGAGISYDAGIPVFKGLFQNVLNDLGIPLSEKEQEVVDAGQFDQAFQILERHMKGPKTVRESAAKFLLPAGGKIPKFGLSKHKAILKLAQTRDRGHIHLVTTNYDPLFDRASHALGMRGVPDFAAPLLPIPKPYDWDGIVYLHGKLKIDCADEKNLNSLILTSGDFGVAYLAERWASRFVSELFKNFTICFVGYRVNDVILRYMMDAIASEEMRGRAHGAVYAFDGCLEGNEDAVRSDWAAKGIELIPYRKVLRTAKDGTRFEDHSELRKVLDKWAHSYSEGISGKSRIVVEEMAHEPDSVSVEGKCAIRRVAWALADPTGVPAKSLAELNPPPSIKWLDELYRMPSSKEWLPLFRVPISQAEKYDVHFSLFSHPPALANAPFVGVVPTVKFGNIDNVQEQLFRWLLCYLNDWQLFNWFVAHSGVLNPIICRRILSCLPGHCPDKKLQDCWRFYLNGMTLAYDDWSLDYAFYNWVEAYKAVGGLTPGLSLQFRNFIQPVVKFAPVHYKQWCDGEACRGEVHLAIGGMVAVLQQETIDFQAALAPFVDDLVLSLERICELREALDDGAGRDLSFFSLPTIAEGKQPQENADWSAAAILLREAWLGVKRTDENRAVKIAKRWAKSKYNLFKRFYLFAATESMFMTVDRTVDFILTQCSLLEDSILHPEILRFFDIRGKEFGDKVIQRIENAILNDNDTSVSKQRVRAMVLDHLEFAGVRLSDEGRTFLAESRKGHVRWNKRNRKFDGLQFYVCEGGEDYPEEDPSVNVLPSETIPDDVKGAVEWLQKYDSLSFALPVAKDPWHKKCVDHSADAMRLLLSAGKNNGFWSHRVWSVALECWRYGRVGIEAWKVFAEKKVDLPEDLIRGLITKISWWLKSVAKEAEEPWLKLAEYCDDTLRQIPDADANDGVYCDEEGMPYQCLAEAILRVWYGTQPQKGGLIADPYVRILTAVADGKTKAYRCARKELLSHITDFYIVDPEWTKSHLVPLLSWKELGKDALDAWAHAIMMPRYDAGFLTLIKDDFIKVADYFSAFDGVRQNWFAALIASMAMSKCDGYVAKDFAGIIRKLPEDGRDEVCRQVFLRMQNAGSGADVVWENEMRQFLQSVWPKEPDYMTGKASAHFMQSITNLDAHFGEAVAVLTANIYGAVPLDLFMKRLWDEQVCKPTLCCRYPAAALTFLSKTSIDAFSLSYAEECQKQLQMASEFSLIAKKKSYRMLLQRIECARVKR